MTYGALFAWIGPYAGPLAWIIIGFVALLLFGNRLPSVMRSLGRSVVEFKKGVKGVQDDVDEVVRTVDENVVRSVEDKA